MTTLWPLYLILLPVGILLLAVALRLLFQRGWVGGFLRGLVGLGALASLVLLGLLLVDLSAFRALSQETVVATLSFRQLDSQHYEAQVAPIGRSEPMSFEVRGDQWQVDARVLNWQGPLAVLGMEPLYRLERFSGRYLDLEQERNASRSVYELEGGHWLDAADIVPRLPWVNSRFGSAAYMPMVDGGLFEVGMTARGLVARPVNQPAREAVDDWFSE
ncbi:hypothetical protein [Saccharospirillum salsuginis]|uniref:Multidrug transporter n=1 Tax=Saccharospirillum salsuginis TaxID=418750 RepID=A0A918N8K1_9GAMM|nr:hypothetical protein [Saccharospirillum salsuginis]GGX51257.1 hypothetical protein GCM10007392_18120 [Saccharospirillum salsuginis]